MPYNFILIKVNGYSDSISLTYLIDFIWRILSPSLKSSFTTFNLYECRILTSPLRLITLIKVLNDAYVNAFVFGRNNFEWNLTDRRLKSIFIYKHCTKISIFGPNISFSINLSTNKWEVWIKKTFYNLCRLNCYTL